MLRKVVIVFAACLVAGVMTGGLAQAGAAPAEAGDAAAAFANALALGNIQHAWQLLSAASQKATDVVQWTNAYEQRAPATKPQPNTVLQQVCSAPEPAKPGKEVVRAGEAFVEVKDTVPITYQIVVVKDPGGWRVDLPATDQLNARASAQLFLEAMREETLARTGRGGRTSSSSRAVLQAVLASQAKDYKAKRITPEGPDRATVEVQADVPVTLVLRETRNGPGWAVDLYRPLAQVDLFSPDPLAEAASLGERQACEAQLALLQRAIEAYCAKSDDMLPDPARWFDQLTQYLPPGTTLHCPSDTGTGVSYAMNRNLEGKRRREVAGPMGVPMFFESTSHARNAADRGESWPTPPRHLSGNVVLSVDGSVKAVLVKPSFEVKKAPPGGVTPTTPRPRPGAVPGMTPGGPRRPTPARPPMGLPPS